MLYIDFFTQSPKYQFSEDSILKYFSCFSQELIVLWFYDTSTLVGHFVSSPRERKISEGEEIVEEMKERDRGERGK